MGPAKPAKTRICYAVVSLRHIALCIGEALNNSAQVGKVVEISELPRKRKPAIEQEIHRPTHDKTVKTRFTSVEAA